MKNNFTVIGKLEAVEGKTEELKDILLKAGESMEKVEGCKLYSVNVSKDDDHLICIMEIWQDEKAHRSSLQLDFIQELIAKGRPLIRKMEGDRYRIVGGKGV